MPLTVNHKLVVIFDLFIIGFDQGLFHWHLGSSSPFTRAFQLEALGLEDASRGQR